MFDLRQILAADGPIARRLGPRYESRPEQLAMMDSVDRALDTGGKLIVEAGTGVGKSFAYLLPAIKHVVSEPKPDDPADGSPRPDADLPIQRKGKRPRIIISTHTIALQEQLVNRDIPLLRAVIPEEFTAVLVKGRGNYVSIRRLKQALEKQNQLFAEPEMLRSLEVIEDWAANTDDGSLATLPQLERPGVWERVQSDSGNCMGRRCPTYQQCFYQQARRRAENADLLVVNHALFFSDLALRTAGVGFLPPYDHVILDEAHNIEDVASDHFGVSVTEAGVAFLLGQLRHARTGRGFLSTLAGRIKGDPAALNRAMEQVMEVENAARTFFDSLDQYQRTRGRNNGRVEQPEILENTLASPIKDLVVLLKLLKDQCEEEPDRYELAGYIGRCESTAAAADTWLGQKIQDSVYWIEIARRGRARRVTVQSAPIDVGPLLRKHLFEATNAQQRPIAVVLTSATLATAAAHANSDEAEQTTDGFAHISTRLGCDEPARLLLGSPFDYQRQAELIIEAGVLEPNAPNYFEQVCPIVLQHIEATDGGAFVLFTSYDLLKRTAEWLRPKLAERGMPMLVHGEGEQRTVLLDRFRGDRRSVLLGADSFWQGVDVQGEGLRNVIIPKLPFAVPDRPLTEARTQRITARGGNAFAEYSLPEAILRFKQGFGRLIRSRSDTGRVVVLDSRIVKKSYGRRFIEALPQVQIEIVRGRRRDGHVQPTPDDDQRPQYDD